ncbi:MAG: sulfur carrier protein [Campylobacterota bacterium]|nr:sulfur carrier protein [Campylobacterota bacterium]
MHLTINGHIKEFQEGVTIEAILKELDLSTRVMAAAVNMQIVKQNEWESYVLKDGDKLELLDFVGGG